MAFMRYASAVVVQPQVSQKGWGKVRTASMTAPRNLVSQASEILGKPFNPDDYLLTHCTIVASVDVEDVPNVKLGRVKIGNSGRTINRKYGNYHIAPQCSQFVNNNGDSWSRNVLMASYSTFIGGHNFLEHIQVEEQSKGRIIDAVARDIGDSVYIDILVATDREHAQLVQDIESGKLGTLSMGCSVEETICTKCGNVAVDEVDLCDCIKYAKLNTFIDDQGQKRIIAELCGHPSLGETGGVNFIEASWVAVPAFTGAVLRNILEPTKMPEAMARRLQAVLESPPPQWDENQRQKAAFIAENLRTGQWDEPEEEAPADSGNGGKPLDALVDEVYEMMRNKVKDRVEDELKGDEVEEALSPEDSTMAPNDTIHKEGMQKRAYQGSVRALLRVASNDAAFVDGLAEINESFGIHVDREVYRTALRVGSLDRYKSVGQFLDACERVGGRSISPAETRVMARIGKLLTRVGEHSTPTAGEHQ